MMQKHFTQVEPLNGYTDPFSADPAAPRPYSHQKNALLRQQLPESTVWNYIVQLTSALRVIHAAGLACRTLDPSKILVTGRLRLRLSSLAIADVLSFDPAASNPLHHIPHYQVCNGQLHSCLKFITYGLNFPTGLLFKIQNLCSYTSFGILLGFSIV